MNFNNKVIWITGASSGIGKALVASLAKQNCQLIISSRRLTDLETVKNAQPNPENIACVPFDLADYNNMLPIVESAIGRFGTIDILINNGGIS